MIAYYIHWHYSASADDANFYAGRDDDKLFHHKENAEKYAKDQISEWNDNSNRFYYLDCKDNEEGLTPEEQEEWRKLAPMVYGDLPNDYTICERDIKFEDEL